MGGGGGSKGEVTYSCVGGEGVEGGGYIIYLWGGGQGGRLHFVGRGCKGPMNNY